MTTLGRLGRSARAGGSPSAERPDELEARPGAQAFDAALAGRCDRLVRSDGVVMPLAPRRWDDDANHDDHWFLDRCTGPTLDLGCGPGRLVAALAIRGVEALGVDVSARAVARCRERGAAVLCRDALGPLPDEGRWTRVVLADGNIGIGGHPARLLRRCRALLATAGSVLVELDPGGGSWQGLAHLEDPDAPIGPDGTSVGAELASRPWFPWAVVGTDAIDDAAARAGLVVVDRATGTDGARCFAELEPGPRRTH